MKAQFDIIFDNGGGVTIQHPDYTHHYDNMEHAAVDAAALLLGSDPVEWDGNEPESRMDYDYITEFNGGYKWLDQEDIANMEYLEFGWANINGFYEALINLPDWTVIISENNVNY